MHFDLAAVKLWSDFYSNFQREALIRSDVYSNLPFRAYLVVGSSLMKLNIITMCFEFNIFHNNLIGNDLVY